MKVNLRIPMMFAIIAMLFAACTSTEAKKEPVDMAKLKTDIQAIEDKFAAAEKAKDVDGVAAYYADDAISYSRGKAPEVGMAAIKAGIAKNIAEDTTGGNNVYKVVDLFAEGDMLVEVGSWTRMTAAGTPSGEGHYMSYFQKRGDKYVCVRDMNVSSTPATAAIVVTP